MGWSLGVGRLGGMLGPLIGGALIGSGMPLAVSCYVYLVVSCYMYVVAAVLGGAAARLPCVRHCEAPTG